MLYTKFLIRNLLIRDPKKLYISSKIDYLFNSKIYSYSIIINTQKRILTSLFNVILRISIVINIGL